MNSTTQHKKYWCPTHPEVQSDEQGAICTQCGTMVLIPNPNHVSNTKIIKPKHGIKEFLPLAGMVAIVAALTVVFDILFPGNWTHTMRHFMGSFFLVFGILKMIKLNDFATAYADYDILAMKSKFYAKLYPFIELAFAAAYLTNWNPTTTNWIVLIVMSVSAIGVYRKVSKKEEIPCACLGMVFKVPMTWVTLVEDLIMALMALSMLLI